MCFSCHHMNVGFTSTSGVLNISQSKHHTTAFHVNLMSEKMICRIVFVVLIVLVLGVACKTPSSTEEEEKKAAAKEAKKYNKYELEQYVKRCPLGWSRLKNDKCFKLFLNETTHAESELICKQQGSTLASIVNENERTYIESLILKEVEPESSLTDLWIGLRRKANKLFWYDLTALESQALPWATSEPSNAADHDCGSISSHYDTLVNATADFCRLKLTNCAELKGFLCQKLILDHCVVD